MTDSFKKLSHSFLELKVCRYLQKQRELPNVVQIYEVTDKFITMEYLVNKPGELTMLQRSRVLTDMLNGLKQLNSIGIIYADIKLGNIGWSIKDQCWKLFDFDMSGMDQDRDVFQKILLGTGYPSDILTGSLDEMQDKLIQLMIPDIINDELPKFLLDPDEVYY